MKLTLIGALRGLDVIRLRSEFYRSWEIALRAKQNIPESLTQMDLPEHTSHVEARQQLIDGIAKGRPLGVVAKLHPDLFPVLDQTLLASGESFSILHDSLRLLSEYYLRDFARLSRIRGWTALPIVVAVVAAFVLPFPLLWDKGGPAYSAAIIGGIVAIYALGGIPVSLLYSVANKSLRIRRPRFAWTLAMGLECGLTFAGAARLAATVGAMDDVGRHLDRIQPKAIKEMSLTQMLDGSGVWPAMHNQVKAADEASEYLSTLRVFAANLESPP